MKEVFSLKRQFRRTDLVRALGSLSWLGAVCCLLAGVFFSGCMPRADQMGQEPAPPYLVHQVRYGGETLSIIAGWYTGKMKNWKKIARANRGLKAERIKVGDEIQIPYELVMRETPLPRSAIEASRIAARKTAPEESVKNGAPAAENGAPAAENGARAAETAKVLEVPEPPSEPTYTANEASARSLQQAAEVSSDGSAGQPAPEKAPAWSTHPAPPPLPPEPVPATLTRDELLKELMND